jgi:hypothetical protein
MSKKQRTSKQMAVADTDQAFDQWVARQLHKVYDEVLNEPVPDELLRLVEQIDAAPATDEPRDDAEECAQAASRKPTDKQAKR